MKNTKSPTQIERNITMIDPKKYPEWCSRWNELNQLELHERREMIHDELVLQKRRDRFWDDFYEMKEKIEGTESKQIVRLNIVGRDNENGTFTFIIGPPIIIE